MHSVVTLIFNVFMILFSTNHIKGNLIPLIAGAHVKDNIFNGHKLQKLYQCKHFSTGHRPPSGHGRSSRPSSRPTSRDQVVRPYTRSGSRPGSAAEPPREPPPVGKMAILI